MTNNTKLTFEVIYDGDLLDTLDCDKNLQTNLESLWLVYDEEYGLSEAYDYVEEWITDLTLNPVYADC